MKVLAFDIEADGLRTATTIHCGVVEDISTGERHEFENALDLYNHLLTADRIVAHNGRMYDCPTLERLVGRPNNLPALPPCLDTLLISRLLWSDKGNTPAGGHSLEKWGEFLKIRKAHTDIEDWSVYTPEMLERCSSDVDIQVALYKYLLPKIKGWGESVQIEHTTATIIQKQIENGFTIDLEKLEELEHELNLARLEEMDKLSHIEPWRDERELKTPAYWVDPLDGEQYRIKGDAPGSARSRLERGPNKIVVDETMFNPNSRDHIIRLFQEKYGWKHTEETDGGKPKMDEKVLSGLDYPEAKVLSAILGIDKILGFTKKWRELEVDGRIHGDVITNGTVAGRMSHSNPNMGQIPSVDKPFGKECRALFKARDGWDLVGMDAKGLEAFMLGNRVSKYDGGEFGRLLESSDIHSVNQELAGLDTRAKAKTFYFKFVYGGKTDPKLEKKLYAACPALKKVKNGTLQFAQENGYVVLIDGRKVPVRKRPLYGTERSEKEVLERRWGIAVNNLLQGDGAMVMKKALCIFYENAVEKFGPHGEMWGLCANVHDEFQVECHPDISNDLGKMMCESVTLSGEHFKMGVTLTGEYKIGKNWSDTH